MSSGNRPFIWTNNDHCGDVIMSTLASQITSLTIVCSNVYSGADQRKHQSSAPLAFVRGIHRWPVNSSHKGQVTRKMFPFDDVILMMTQFNDASMCNGKITVVIADHLGNSKNTATSHSVIGTKISKLDRMQNLYNHDYTNVTLDDNTVNWKIYWKLPVAATGGTAGCHKDNL